MSTTERRERARQELRQAILAAARQLAREGGWGAVTIRRVAQQVEYSPPAIYEYFASKEAILSGLIEDGFAQLHHRVAASAAAEQARERILQAADAHWEFAMENPQLYRAMYGLDAMPFRTGEPRAGEGAPAAEAGGARPAGSVGGVGLAGANGGRAGRQGSVTCRMENGKVLTRSAGTWYG